MLIVCNCIDLFALLVIFFSFCKVVLVHWKQDTWNKEAEEKVTDKDNPCTYYKLHRMMAQNQQVNHYITTRKGNTITTQKKKKKSEKGHSTLRTNSHSTNHEALCSHTHVNQMNRHLGISPGFHFHQSISNNGQESRHSYKEQSFCEL